MKNLFKASLLLVLITIMLVSAVAAKGNQNLLCVKLVDSKQKPISNVTLQAWHTGIAKYRDKAVTNKAGEAIFRLEEGCYFIGGNVSSLYSKLGYRQDLASKADTGLYYSSSQIDTASEENQVLLTVDEKDYIDIGDYNSRNISELTVKQKETKMNISLNPKGGTKVLRLYLPQRKTYEIGCYNGDFTILRPIHVFPGLKFVIGSY